MLVGESVRVKAAPAEFYEQAMGLGSRAMLPLEQSPWLPMYQEAARWIRPADKIVDLGCGTGRFAAMLAESGHKGGYTGFDFAAAVVGEAAAYLEREHPAYPVDELAVRDLREWQPPDIRPPNTVYTCLEVLEHLDDDLQLVERVPGGHRLIFSVPNYGSQAHLRRFATPAAIWARYGDLVTFARWTLIPTGVAGNAIHVLDANRRIDSWN